MLRWTISWTIIALILSLFPLQDAHTASPSTSSKRTLKRDLKRILSRFSACSSLSLVVKSKRGMLFDFNGDRTLIPASSLKIVTAIAALSALGKERRFPSKLYGHRISAEGVLNGPLFILGGGDPSLGVSSIKGNLGAKELLGSWCNALKARGVKEIRGDIVGLTGLFVDQSIPRYAIWEDLGNYYGGISSALSFRNNQYEVILSSPNEPGAAVRLLYTKPEYTGIDTWINELSSGAPGSGDNAYIFGTPMSSKRRLIGTIPPGRRAFTIKGSLPFPGYTCAREFKEVLLKRGIPVRGRARRAVSTEPKGFSGSTLLHMHQSPPLAILLRHMLKKSDNLFAEQILKLLGHHILGEGSREAGIRAMKLELKKLKLPLKGMHIKDGSGLSRYNGVSTKFLLRCLAAAREEDFFQALYESLPVSGVDGSLSRRYADSVLKTRIRAKTGYMERVFALAGYLQTEQGKQLTFAFIVNNADAPFAIVQRRFSNIARVLVSTKLD